MNAYRTYSKKIGVISDTHGLVRPKVIEALKDVDLIIHAGDIGKPEVLETLQKIAKVYHVKGNVDTGMWTNTFPKTAVVKTGKVFLYVIHDVDELDLNPVTAGFSVVIYGHSHRPKIEDRNGVLFLNPGSAGQRRFSLPESVAILNVKGKSVEAELINLEE
ncbi:MAG: metallophosphoesterase family protein [Candidatus Anammoxibacter sp.]